MARFIEGNERPEGFYVYLLMDPFTGAIFYVGKGKGRRYAQHLREYRKGVVANAKKFGRIAALVAKGAEPKVVIVREGLSEVDAFSLERTLIRHYGRDTLTNAVPGQTSNAEKDKAFALAYLKRVYSFDEWLARKPRSDFEIKIFKGIMKTLRAMADGTMVSEATVWIRP